MKRIVAILVGLAIFVPVVTFAQGKPTSTEQASPAASPVVSDVGISKRIGDWTITLVASEFADQLPADAAVDQRARGKFVIVRLTVVNETLDPALFPYDAFLVRDSKGRRFEVNHDATSSLMIGEQDLMTNVDDLQPSITYDYVLVFDIAKDASGLTLLAASDDVFRLGI